MKKLVVLLSQAFVFSVLSFILFSSVPSTVQAQKPLPPNDHARGLVYDGLQVSDNSECKGSFKVKLPPHARPLCTHGPDPAPTNLDIKKRVAPVSGVAYATKSSTVTSSPTFSSFGIMCDGDGQTGKRLEVLYAHASDVASNLATYQTSFQQWLAGADARFDKSAAQSGGNRHIRFVSDSNCNPIVSEVALSPTGDDTFANTINELEGKGYNRGDRKYLVFMDAQVYCGISLIAGDDQPGTTNINNAGDMFARVDAGCWTADIAAHEIMHMLGGAQLTSPHSDGNWHTNDGYDLLSLYSGHSAQIVCPDTSNGVLFDCNHEDYYTTNPAPGSYLSTHWNAASNQFLITPVTARVDSLLTGSAKGKAFTAGTAFAAGSAVSINAHAVDQLNANLRGVAVSITVNKPDGTAQCSLNVNTDTSGSAVGSCSLPRDAPSGTWKVRIVNLVKSGYSADMAGSIKETTFTVK